jgi:ABC-type cobalt transport system substrate-binding protein
MSIMFVQNLLLRDKDNYGYQNDELETTLPEVQQAYEIPGLQPLREPTSRMASSPVRRCRQAGGDTGWQRQ